MAGSGGGSGRWLRWGAIVILLLLGLHAARSAFVAAAGRTHPHLAMALWPSHPGPQLDIAMGAIGAAARKGRPPSSEALALVEHSARGAPLATQPLVVTATDLLVRGQATDAERLLEAALRRDPRDPAARFLLADLLLRQGRLKEGLHETAALQRRLGNVAATLGPAIAEMMKQPGVLAEAAPTLAAEPALREAALGALAGDLANAPLIADLAQPVAPAPGWLAGFTEQLLKAGRTADAARIWERSTGTAIPTWTADVPASVPPPFGWRGGASDSGIAERTGDGAHRLITYGRVEGPLAQRLLILPGGRFFLSYRATGDLAEVASVEWRITCVSSGKVIVAMPVLRGDRQFRIDVPRDCRAQRMVLHARANEFPRTSTLSVANVAVVPALQLKGAP